MPRAGSSHSRAERCAGERRLRPGPARPATPAGRSGHRRCHRRRGGDRRRGDQAVGSAALRARVAGAGRRGGRAEPHRDRGADGRSIDRHPGAIGESLPAGRTSPRPSRPTTPGASARSPSINGSTGWRPARRITSCGAPRLHRPARRPPPSAAQPTRCRCSGSPVRAPRSRETSGSGGSTSRTPSNGSMRPRSAPSPRRPRCCSSGRGRIAGRWPRGTRVATGSTSWSPTASIACPCSSRTRMASSRRSTLGRRPDRRRPS